jgi:hypothetical protein
MRRAMALGMGILFSGVLGTAGSGTSPALSPCAADGANQPTAQERIVQRDIQEVIDQNLEEFGAKDIEALSRHFPAEFTIRLLDGTTLNREQVLEGMRKDLESVLTIDVDRTYTRIERLTLAGKEATLYTQQRYVRMLPDRKNGSPHEVITSVRHRETWTYMKDGWVATHIEELEQGPTYLDGELYDPR